MKKVVLVGHCGPDSSYLRNAVLSADKSIKILAADDDGELQSALSQAPDLVLLNRELAWGFEQTEGVELIRKLRDMNTHLKIMLISNYQEAQTAAVEAGAMPGFGKREIGSPRVTQLLRDALDA